MAIHILGNGPSLAEFDRSDFPSSDIVVGCNFSDSRYSPDYTVIVDVRAMKQFRGGVDRAYHLSIPAVLSDRAYKYIEETRGGWDRVPSGIINVIDVIPLIRDTAVSKKLAANSGQHAADYAIRNHYEHAHTLHIWGCDSFWGTDIQSSTDRVIGGSSASTRTVRRDRPGIIGPWHGYWFKIFEWHPQTSFIIHTSKGVDPTHLNRSWGKNVSVT